MTINYDLDKDMRYLQGQATGLAQGLEKGIEKGIEKGKHQQCTLATRNMLQKGLNIFLIADLLEVSPEFVTTIYEEMQRKQQLFAMPAKSPATPDEIFRKIEAPPVLL